jgi:hypothetical protein
MWRDRFHRWAWRLAAVGMVLAASLVMVGGVAAGSNRSFSDLLVLAGFCALIPSVMLGWLGLPAASKSTSFASSFTEEPLQ